MIGQDTTASGQQKIQGVFSTEKTMRIGAGTTAKRTKQKVSYFVQENDAGEVELQTIGPNNVPIGPTETITKDELLQDYMPDPSAYKVVMANVRNMQKSVARGEKFRKRGETFTAEFEFNKALAIDEENVRANFGVGMCYMQRGEEGKAQEVFERIVKIDAAFQEKHKHLFNEYGIELRKTKMLNEAVEYYHRALELTQEDENLWCNLARAEFERENYKESSQAAEMCLKMAPEHPVATKLLAYLAKKGLV